MELLFTTAGSCLGNAMAMAIGRDKICRLGSDAYVLPQPRHIEGRARRHLGRGLSSPTASGVRYGLWAGMIVNIYAGLAPVASKQGPTPPLFFSPSLERWPPECPWVGITALRELFSHTGARRVGSFVFLVSEKKFELGKVFLKLMV